MKCKLISTGLVSNTNCASQNDLKKKIFRYFNWKIRCKYTLGGQLISLIEECKNTFTSQEDVLQGTVWNHLLAKEPVGGIAYLRICQGPAVHK